MESANSISSYVIEKGLVGADRFLEMMLESSVKPFTGCDETMQHMEKRQVVNGWEKVACIIDDVWVHGGYLFTNKKCGVYKKKTDDSYLDIFKNDDPDYRAKLNEYILKALFEENSDPNILSL